MQVRIKNTFCGYLIIPVSQKVQREIKDHLEEYGEKFDGSFYVQDYELEQYGYSDILRLTRSDIRDLESGWPVTKNKVDSWEFWHGIVGYMSG